MKTKPLNIWLHLWGTTLHKFWVAFYMTGFAVRLVWRAVIHDYSKFGLGESRGFFRVIHKLKHSTYGTPEYQELLDEIAPSLKLHYARWSHHPEHYDNGMRGMSLADLVEMFCDWKAAVRRHTDGDIHRSIRINQDRFEYSDDIRSILANSAGPQKDRK